MAEYWYTITETWYIDEEYVDKDDLKASLESIAQDTNSNGYDVEYGIVEDKE